MRQFRSIVFLFLLGIFLIPQVAYASNSVHAIVAKAKKTCPTIHAGNVKDLVGTQKSPCTDDDGDNDDDSNFSFDHMELDWVILTPQRMDFTFAVPKTKKRFYYHIPYYPDLKVSPWHPPKIA